MGCPSSSPRYRKSRYTVTSVDPSLGLILYSTFTGALVRVDPEQAPAIESWLSSGTGPPEMEQELVVGGFVVPAGADEVSSCEQAERELVQDGAHLSLILLPTNECNFRCVYCYQNFEGPGTSDAFRKAVRRLVELESDRIERLSVLWFGGEPLLALDVVRELSQGFMQASQKAGFEYCASMSTNGYLLTPEVAADLLAVGIRTFQVTLDGPAAAHDKRRALTNGQPTFSRIAENLVRLASRKEHFSVDIRVNLDKDNVRQIPSLLETLSELFHHDHRFSVYFRPITRFGECVIPLTILSWSEAERRILELSEMAVNHGLHVRSLRDALLPHGLVCYAADPRCYIIGTTLNVMKCTAKLYEPMNVVGRLREDGELDIDPARLQLWSSLPVGDPRCQQCFLRPSCHGLACPWVRIKTGVAPCPLERRHIDR